MLLRLDENISEKDENNLSIYKVNLQHFINAVSPPIPATVQKSDGHIVCWQNWKPRERLM